MSRGLQPVLGNLQQLLIVLVTETVLREAREALGAQETGEQEDFEEDWGEEKGETWHWHSGTLLRAHGCR